MKRAVGYIRQSRQVREDPALSEPTQRAAIAKLAVRDGFNPDQVTIFVDLGKSGGPGKEKYRESYQRFMADLESGEVDHVYALSMTRIARSVTELYRLIGICRERNILVTFEHGGTLDPNSATGKIQFGIFALFAEFERDLAVERALDNHVQLRLRREQTGQRYGKRPYEDREGNRADEVVRLFRANQSLSATATALNDAGITSTHGRKWQANSVRKVLVRLAPDLLPTRTKQGVKPVGSYRFFRLLKCGHCGTILTGSTDRRRANGVISYRCYKADTDTAHPRVWVREDAVTGWVQDELMSLQPKPKDAEQFAHDEQRLARLQANLVALREEYLDPDAVEPMAKDDYQARKGAIQDRIAHLRSDVRARAVPDGPRMVRDWDRATPEELNRFLRDAFRWIELGPDLRPVRAEWTVPEWRLTEVPATATG